MCLLPPERNICSHQLTTVLQAALDGTGCRVIRSSNFLDLLLLITFFFL
jgi:hypothetical protein